MNFCENDCSVVRACACSGLPCAALLNMVQVFCIRSLYFCFSSSVRHCSLSMSSALSSFGPCCWPAAAAWGWELLISKSAAVAQSQGALRILQNMLDCRYEYATRGMVVECTDSCAVGRGL